MFCLGLAWLKSSKPPAFASLKKLSFPFVSLLSTFVGTRAGIFVSIAFTIRSPVTITSDLNVGIVFTPVIVATDHTLYFTFLTGTRTFRLHCLNSLQICLLSKTRKGDSSSSDVEGHPRGKYSRPMIGYCLTLLGLYDLWVDVKITWEALPQGVVESYLPVMLAKFIAQIDLVNSNNKRE